MENIKYHITPSRNLVSILIDGLKVNQRDCMAHHYAHFRKAYQVKPIFLTDDPERIIKEQLTPSWVKEKNPVILSVNVEGLSLIPEYDCVDWMPKPILPDYTWISIDNISPWRLKLTNKKHIT